MSPNTNQQIQEKAQIAGLIVLLVNATIQIISAGANLATLFAARKTQ